jgi:DUF1009 family protein
MSGGASVVAAENGPLAIICGGGSLPFAVAQAAQRSGRRVVLFAIRDFADRERVAAFPHHWVSFGQFGLFRRLARQEGCRDVVMIGTVVRPAIWRIRPDLVTLRMLPRIVSMFRGGDNRLLSGVARLFEENGFRLLGAHELAPEILMPQGVLGRVQPHEGDHADIARGLAVLAACSPYDVGQAVVMAQGRVLAIEAAEGTDQMLLRVAQLRASGRIAVRGGVLIKAAKRGQDMRVDLPSLGPRTVEGVARAGLAGMAAVAGSAIVAEPDALVRAADDARLFVVGVRDDATLER